MKIFNKYGLKGRIIAATPLVSTILFLALGFFWDLWHPGWLAFLLIPIVPVLLGFKQIRISYFMVCVVVYVTLGIIFDIWHPLWIIFLTVPVVTIFTAGTKYSKGAVIIGKKKESHKFFSFTTDDEDDEENNKQNNNNNVIDN